MRLRHTGLITALIAILGTNAFGQSLSIASESGDEVRFVVPLGIEAPPNAVAAFRDDALITKYEYPSPLQTIETDPRGVVTTTDLDAWDRPVRVHVAHPDDHPLVLEQNFLYDATGRLERTTEKKGSSVVTTTHAYDAMGRPISTTRDGIATVGSVTTTSYIRRELQARGATPAEYRAAYNDLNNTILRCRRCNRTDNQVIGD